MQSLSLNIKCLINTMWKNAVREYYKPNAEFACNRVWMSHIIDTRASDVYLTRQHTCAIRGSRWKNTRRMVYGPRSVRPHVLRQPQDLKISTNPSSPSPTADTWFMTVTDDITSVITNKDRRSFIKNSLLHFFWWLSAGVSHTDLYSHSFWNIKTHAALSSHCLHHITSPASRIIARYSKCFLCRAIRLFRNSSIMNMFYCTLH